MPVKSTALNKTTHFDRPTVGVTIFRHEAVIDPRTCPCQLIKPVLTGVDRHYVSDGPSGYQLIDKEHPYYRVNDDGSIATPAGLIPRFHQHIRRLGYRVEIQDRSRWPVLQQAIQRIPDMSENEAERQYLSKVLVHPRGQIVVNEDGDMARRIAPVIDLLRNHRILLVVGARQQQRRLHRHLKKYLNRAWVQILSNNTAWGRRPLVLICTIQMFAACDPDWDAVIFVEPRTVLAEQAFDRASRMRESLLYCVVPSDRELYVNERLRLETVCGAVIHDDRRSGSGPEQIRVEMADYRQPAGVTGDDQDCGGDSETLGGLEAKRSHIWHDEDRNQAIATIAQALVSNDMAKLWRHGLLLREDEDYLASQYPERHVWVLVEAIEHGEQFQSLLPNWPLASSYFYRQLSAQYGLVTQSYADRHLVTANIVIDAVGGAGAPQIEDWLSWPQEAGAHQLLIIDMKDSSTQSLSHDTAARLQDYRHQGWNVPESTASTST